MNVTGRIRTPLFAAIFIGLQACSADRPPTRADFQAISTKCGLTNARLVRRGGKHGIALRAHDNTDEKFVCVHREIEEKGLAATIRLGTFREDRPPAS